MEKLLEYIDEIGGAVLAGKLGVSRGLVSHWRRGRKVPTPIMAKRLEEVSGGQITRVDIRPDVFGDAA